MREAREAVDFGRRDELVRRITGHPGGRDALQSVARELRRRRGRVSGRGRRPAGLRLATRPAGGSAIELRGKFRDKDV